MKALITGASSGIGRDMAIYLSKLGYDVILVARDKTGLEETKTKIKTKSMLINMDLQLKDSCYKLYDMVKEENIDILINNAGFGLFGEFTNTDLNKELDMINLNINAVHILTKLFLKDMVKRDSGYILNVASSAAFQPGPLMATYYSTKAYVLRLTASIYGELRAGKSNVVVSALCPGPVKTNFNKVAGVNFSLKALSSVFVAKYAVDNMFKKKLIIIPGLYMKAAYIVGKIIPLKWIINIAGHIQRKKITR